MSDKTSPIPCPFCGRMPEVTRYQYRTSIRCANKHCVGYFGVVSKVHADENVATAAAIAAWNARYYPPEVIAALKFYYNDDLYSVAEDILESADKRPAAHALRAIGVLP